MAMTNPTDTELDALEKRLRNIHGLLGAADVLAALRRERDEALEERDAAERKVKKLREALAFYARHTVYQTSTVYMSGARGPTEIECDGGDRARAALTGMETSNVDRG